MINPAGGTPTGRLAPHETIELHELLSLKTTTLVKQKETVGKIVDPQLRQLYLQSIQMTEKQIVELMHLLQNRAILP
jgi:hypothetical protein